MRNANPELDALNEWMRAHHMHGFWVQGGGGTGVQVKPYLWKWAELRSSVHRAPSSNVAEPRTFALQNPEQRGVPSSLSLSLQLLHAGERTESRPNSANEAFLVLGDGANAILDAESFLMEAGDLIVAPLGVNCGFRNTGGETAAGWLKGTDAGLLRLIGVEVDASPLGIRSQSGEKNQGYSAATRRGMASPLEDRQTSRGPMRYAWRDTFATLVAHQREKRNEDAADGIHLRYTNPSDGGPTLPTLSCEVELLSAGLRTRAHRHNSTTIHYVFRGRGRTVVADEQLDWTEGDVFCIPPWAPHHHENPGHDEAILFSIDDWPTMKKMGFYREEHADA